MVHLLGRNPDAMSWLKPVSLFRVGFQRSLLVCLAAWMLGHDATGQSTNFNFSGQVQQYTVPPCVNQIQVQLRGAKGGGFAGGNGATVNATLNVTPGQVLEIRVGGLGGCPGAGYNGGGVGKAANVAANASCGGGGASDIRVAPYGLANRLAVAAGGGGMGGGNTDAIGGAGGCATGTAGTSPFGVGGGAATQFSGGAGGPSWNGSGQAGGVGTSGVGGTGGTDICFNLGPGGGGGGGYWGGGGGGSDCFGSGSLGGGGGGGGSSLTPAGGTCTGGNVTGNGLVTITPIGGLALNVTPTNPFFCPGGSVTLNITGADTYAWSGGEGLSAYTGNSVVAQPGSTTTYTVVGTTAACTDSTTVTVTVGNTPVIHITPPNPSLCTGDPVTLTASGAATYSWSPSTGLNVSAGPVVVANPTQATTYTVTGTAQGCSAQASVTVAFEVEVETTAYLCPGATYNLPDGTTTSAAGTYVANFVTALGCDSTITTELVPAQTYNLTASTTLCAGSTYTLPDGTEVDASGTYPVVLEAITGCDSLVTTVVDILPVLQSAQSIALCAGETTVLPDGTTTETAGVYAIAIPSSIGCDSTVVTTVVVNENYNQVLQETTCANIPYLLPDGTVAPGPGTYPFALTSTAGCDSNVVIALDVAPAYQLTLNPEICAGSSYMLPNGQSVQVGGVYPVPLVTSAGCDSVITVQLVVNPLPQLNLGVADAYCFDETVVPLSPSPAGGTLSGPTVQGFNLVHNGVAPGNYNVQYSYTDANGCSATSTATYVFTPAIVPDFVGAARCSELRLENLSSGGAGDLAYTWRANGTIFSEFPSPIFGFPTDGLYEIVLTAEDIYGCANSVTEVFDLEESLDLSGFQIPNVITPNDDNWNDVLRLPYAAEECLRYELLIFNRWGGLVYRQTHQTAAFSGLDAQGEPLADGLYYYTFETVDFACGSRPELKNWCTGTLQILR